MQDGLRKLKQLFMMRMFEVLTLNLLFVWHQGRSGPPVLKESALASPGFEKIHEKNLWDECLHLAR